MRLHTTLIMDDFLTLAPWGWSALWQAQFDSVRDLAPRGLDVVPARVVGREGPYSVLATPQGERLGLVSGRFQFSATESELPLVGDWVGCHVVDDQAVIHLVVPRQTLFSRAVSDGSKDAAGRESALAANVDVLAIVTGLDGNFNPRRAQRLATLARHGGLRPVWILSKADLPGAAEKIDAARRAAGDDPVLPLSSLTGEGLEALSPYLLPGTTLALTGSSGVGKTTLVNRLRDSSLATQDVRSDSKGRHTTTSRHLYPLPGGALLMDTPGFRTVGLWADSDDLAAGFSDLEALAASCKFHDCRHQDEPGCAVRAALADGTLAPERWDGWQRQERELAHLARRDDKALQRAEKDRWKAIHVGMKGFSKQTRSLGN